MKIEGTMRDVDLSKDSGAIKAEAELRWMSGKIQEENDELWERQRDLFYREQMFGAYYKSHCYEFSPMCPPRLLFTSVENGLFAAEERDKPESKSILNCVVVNYFPKWMWDDLRFSEVICEGWDMRGVELHFRWNCMPKGGRRKRREVDFCISVPNPDRIQTDGTFDPENAKKVFLRNNYKTKATVCVDVAAAEKTHVWNYDWVCAAYLNDEIIAGIDKWAGKFIGRESSGEKGKENGHGVA